MSIRREGHWLTASTFIFPPFHLIIISWSSSFKMYSCGREYIYTWIGVYVYTWIHLETHIPWWVAGLYRFSFLESTYKKCLREEWGKFTGYQLLSSFWLKVARTEEDRNTTRWDRGTLPIRNLYPKWGMLRFGRMRKVTNWIWTLWFIVSY